MVYPLEWGIWSSREMWLVGLSHGMSYLVLERCGLVVYATFSSGERCGEGVRRSGIFSSGEGSGLWGLFHGVAYVLLERCVVEVSHGVAHLVLERDVA